MSSSSSALPTPRQLLTLILNQISRIPAPTTPGRAADGLAQDSSTITRIDSFPERAAQPPSNPLGLIDPRHRPLFTTLHVLFPSLLLPALDLLDRGLVTRMVSPVEAAEGCHHPLAHHHQQDDGPQETQEEKSDGGSQPRDPTEAPPTTPPPSVYIVRSAQKPARRPYGAGAGGDAPTTTTATATASSQRAYVVHTAAWNCTCAAFAFSAFPPLSGPSLLAPTESRAEHTVPPVTVIEDDADSVGDMDVGQGSGPWQFGGASFDGCTEMGGVPPCCKHLLACVLAERWESGLGKYVSRWEVGREEMAGVFADV